MSEYSVKRVKIQIMGHPYSIKTDGEEEYVHRIAQYINEKSQQIMQATQSVTTLDVMIKVAINLADELFQERRSKERLCQEVEDEARGLIRQIERHLEESLKKG